MVIMLHLKVFLLPREGFCVCVVVFLIYFFSPFLSLSLFPFPLLRVKMMSWTERKHCSGIEGKARVTEGHNKVSVYNPPISCFKNERFQDR